ncbi:MAG TPA: PP0621 family protein [Albitalea sp.]|nr:PP0621 family protein [Albitalea sp.]
MAKILLLILVVLVVLWFARAGRGRVAPPKPRAADSPRHEPMVSCAHCGLHLPSSEALPGRGGVFCGEAHRAAYERAHPPQ